MYSAFLRHLSVVMCCATVTAAAVRAQTVPAGPALNLSGRWAVVTGTVDDPSPYIIDVTMDKAGHLSGKVGNDGAGWARIDEGVVDRDSVHLSFTIAGERRVVYDAQVRNDTLRGRWTFGGDTGALLGVRGEKAPRPERKLDGESDQSSNKPTTFTAAIDSSIVEFDKRTSRPSEAATLHNLRSLVAYIGNATTPGRSACTPSWYA